MSTKKTLLLANSITLGMIALTIFIYFPPYAHAFVGDDFVQLDYILEFVAQPWSAIKVFNPFWTGWYYRPLQNLWFLGGRILFNFNPFGYYWVGLLLHGLVVALAYRVARQMGIRPFFALLVATLFAIQKHHLDVVTWISAVAIVMVALFSLAALSAYLHFLARARAAEAGATGRRYLLLSLFFFLLALFSHEESILLLPLLLWWRLDVGNLPGAAVWTARFREYATALRTRLTRVTREEWIVWGATAVLIAGYVALQLTRPNLTISLQETPGSHWWANMAPAQLARFTAETAGKYLPFASAQAVLAQNSYIVALIALALLGAWFWYGDRVTRFGLIWALLHLAFIYWALWTQKPELYAGRHIYNSWFGVVLAVGATLQKLEERNWLPGPRQRRRKQQRLYVRTFAALLTLVVIIVSILSTRQVQSRWLANVTEEESAREQLAEMFPILSDSVHLFAVRFPVTPDFLRSVTQVWYEQETALPQPFGPLSRLQQHGEATYTYYLLDWDSESGRLYNLMPELRLRDRTIFLWQESPRYQVMTGAGKLIREEANSEQTMSVAGPEDDRRLALVVEPFAGEAWQAAVYEETIPDIDGITDVFLETAVRRAPDGESTTPLQARVRLTAGNDTITLYEDTLSPDTDLWFDMRFPLNAFAGRTVTIRLETSGDSTAYWANPRLGIIE